MTLRRNMTMIKTTRTTTSTTSTWNLVSGSGVTTPTPLRFTRLSSITRRIRCRPSNRWRLSPASSLDRASIAHRSSLFCHPKILFRLTTNNNSTSRSRNSTSSGGDNSLPFTTTKTNWNTWSNASRWRRRSAKAASAKSSKRGPRKTANITPSNDLEAPSAGLRTGRRSSEKSPN